MWNTTVQQTRPRRILATAFVIIAATSLAREIGGDRLVLIGSGGVFSGEDAVAATDAGADLVQLWTGLVYRGPGLIGETVGEMSRRLSPPS